VSSHHAPDFFETLFYAAPVGLALSRLDTGRFVEVNQAYADLIGRTIEETLKLSHWHITPKKFEKLQNEQLRLLRKNKRYGPYEKEYIRKDGTLIPVRLSGSIVKIRGRDYIWSRAESLLDETYHKLFLAAKPALALNRLDDGSLVAVNQAYADMIGYTIPETLELTYWEITPTKFANEEETQLKKLKENKEYGPYQKQYIHKSGKLFDVVLAGILIEIGGIDYVWSFVEAELDGGAIVLKDEPATPIEDRSAAKAEWHKPIKTPAKRRRRSKK
jgi:PAS domain S-box-containing protein